MRYWWLIIAAFVLSSTVVRADGLDVIVINGRSMAPLRTVSETFGTSVNYDTRTKQVNLSLDYQRVNLAVGRRSATVCGKTVNLDASPVVIAGVTYVPIRFISEAFGAEVVWVTDSRQVKIIHPGSGKKIIMMVKDGPGKPHRTTVSTPQHNDKPHCTPVKEKKADHSGHGKGAHKGNAKFAR